MTKIIALANEKGGVAKTTTALNLSYELAQGGKKVLLVDLDPQANLTRHCGIKDPNKAIHSITTLMGEMIDNLMDSDLLAQPVFPDIKDVIIHKDGFDFIPSNIHLEVAEKMLYAIPGSDIALGKIIDFYKEGYDFVLIDCRPSLSALTINALNCCDRVIIPCQAEPYSVQGLEALLKNIMRIKERMNPKIMIEGILLTLYRADYNLSKDLTKAIKELYGDLNIFRTCIPVSIKVAESAILHKPMALYRSKNPVSEAYKNLAKEILN